jgi:methylenetetrahydrofolate reductase (NADPH)
MQAAGVDDMFLIGGDADPAVGDYASAVELLPVMAEHAQRPRTIGIAGYPEGHPLIEQATLDRVLLDKSRVADYITTQLCFDPDALLAWVRECRERGITVPVLIGMPGKVMAARLLEMSARIGVGPSMAFIRKQRGLGNLLSLFRRSQADRLYDALAPAVGDPILDIAGFHYFTFNQLIATYEWQHDKRVPRDSARRAASDSPAPSYARPEESRT